MFKKIFIGLALAAFAVAPLPALATQVINDNLTVNGQFLTSTHVGQVASPTQVPAVTGTGTPTIATGSSDRAGTVTAGASATSVVITFATAYSGVPVCIVNTRTLLAAFSYVVIAASITITQTATSGNLIDYQCVALGGGI